MAGERPSDAGRPAATSGGTGRGPIGPLTDRRVVLGLTFVVAFCSIAYELVYSQFLTVFYGGTVVRYSVTIGLYLFSLGVGAFLSSHLADPGESFLRTEVYLAFCGPAGAGWMIALNSFPSVAFPGKEPIALALSHAPILAVGLLSGFEIPLLNELLEEREGSPLAAVSRWPRRALRALLAPLYPLSEPDGDSVSEVLGVDYLGSLAGTLGYALVLYPRLGLVVTVVALGLANAVAALAFAAWTRVGSPSRSGRDGDGVRALALAGLLLTGAYAGLVVNAGAVDRAVTGAYIGDRIESEYRPGRASVTVRSHETTAYQTVVTYERDVDAHEGTETCLRLDRALQLCDSWVESYHSGLVDVPMSRFENASSVDVLLVGGGDYVAVDRLREYGASVDQVDLDGEFMAMARNRSFYRRFHRGAHEYDRLNTTVADAVTYVRETNETYDLVVLDVPGARSDDALPLYSVEFYRLLRQRLTDRGVVVTWVYSRYSAAEHHRAYANTVRAAGFDRYAPYSVYNDLDGDGEHERGERFYLLSDGPTPPIDLARAESDYVREHADRIGPVRWRPLPRYDGVRPNSLFHPNYDLIVE